MFAGSRIAFMAANLSVQGRRVHSPTLCPKTAGYTSFRFAFVRSKYRPRRPHEERHTVYPEVFVHEVQRDLEPDLLVVHGLVEERVAQELGVGNPACFHDLPTGREVDPEITGEIFHEE